MSQLYEALKFSSSRSLLQIRTIEILYDAVSQKNRLTDVKNNVSLKFFIRIVITEGIKIYHVEREILKDLGDRCYWKSMQTLVGLT